MLAQLTRKTLAVVLVGVVVVATAGLALAADDGESTDDVPEVVDDSAGVEEGPADAGTDAETDDEGTIDESTGAEITPSEATPGEGEPRNHGEVVSEAARGDCPPGPGHGQCVSAVARSDAGKPPNAGGENGARRGPPEGRGHGGAPGGR